MRHKIFPIVLALVLLIITSAPAYTQSKPKAILILVSNATFGDLRENGRLPAVRKLAEHGGIGLVHNRVWGGFNENAAYLSVGASERMAAPANGYVSLTTVRDFQPPVANRKEKVGAFQRALSRAEVRVAVKSPSPATLVAMGDLVPPWNTDFYITHVASASEANVIAVGLNRAQKPTGTIYIAIPFTPEIKGGKPYRHLGFLVAVGPGIKSGTLLTSPTTRTPGLVANVDIAPTITELYGTAIPGAAGQPVRAVANRDVWETLDALDQQTNAAARATTPVLAGYGIFAGVSCLFTLAALHIASRKAQVAARFLLLVAAGVLPALLAVGIIAPQTPGAYGTTLAVIAFGVASLAHILAPRLRTSALNLVFCGLVVCIVADSFLRTQLVERSLLSASTLTGIRFYGIGNEWFGLLLGAALACAAPWWLGVLVIGAVGLPYFGADAGGTLAATTAFTVLFFAQRTGGLKRRHFAAAVALSFAVTGIFALLDRLQPGDARSHVGAAVVTGEAASGIGTLSEIALRKVAMNASLLLSPWTLLTVIAMIAIGFGLRRLTGSTNPSSNELRAATAPAAVSGAVVAFLFNDGGVAAGLLIMVPVLVRSLDALLADRIERESVVSE